MAAQVTPAQLRKYIVEGTITETLAFGFLTCLFLYTIGAFLRGFRQQPDQRRPLWSLVALVIAFTSAAVHAGLTWWYTVKMFEEFGDDPSFLLRFSTLQPKWFVALGTLAFLGCTFIAESIAIWRCYLTVGRRLWVVLIPIATVITGGVLNILSLTAHIQVVEQRTSPAVTVNAKFASFFTPYLCLSLGTTLYTTIIITAQHFVTHQSRGLSLLRTLAGAASDSEVVVESALLYSIVHIVAVAYLVRGLVAFVYPQNLLPQIAGIAGTLIILRTESLNKASRAVHDSEAQDINRPDNDVGDSDCAESITKSEI